MIKAILSDVNIVMSNILKLIFNEKEILIRNIWKVNGQFVDLVNQNKLKNSISAEFSLFQNSISLDLSKLNFIIIQMNQINNWEKIENEYKAKKQEENVFY